MKSTLYDMLNISAINPNGPDAATLLRQIATRLREASRRRELEEYGSAWIEISAAMAMLSLAGVPGADT